MELADPVTAERMHLQVGVGTLQAPSELCQADGASLVDKCLLSIDTLRFPPGFFILWATPAFYPYAGLLEGIHRRFEERGVKKNASLIGGSVAVCVFDGGPQKDGAVLICVASRHVEARIGVALTADIDPPASVSTLLKQLGISSERDVNPGGNQFLISFLPGYDDTGDPLSYKASEIVEELRSQSSGRLRLFGGVSSAGLKSGMGSQFAGKSVLTQAIVGALVECNATFGIGLNHGLIATGESFDIAGTDRNGRVIISLRETDSGDLLSATSVVAKLGNTCVFGTETGDGGQIIVVPRRVGDRVMVLRKVDDGARLHILKPNSHRMKESLAETRAAAIDRFRLSADNLAIAIGIGCVSRYRHRTEISFDLPSALAEFKERFPKCAYVGCYMDGELGINRMGQPALSNWSVSQLLLGDRISSKAELLPGFYALKDWTMEATTAGSLDLAMERSLRCIKAAGREGAMISLVLDDGEKRWIVARKAIGELWNEVVLERTARDVSGEDILSIVAREKRSFFIRNAQSDTRCHQETARLGNVLSFYAIPLLDVSEGNATGTLGVLQIDLGDMRRIDHLPEEQKAVLDAIGAMIGAAVNRAILNDELRLVRAFDQLLPDCASKPSVSEAVLTFVAGTKAVLGTDAHIRLVTADHQELRLIGGIGQYYDAIKNSRVYTATDDEWSPAARAFREGRFNVFNDAHHLTNKAMAQLLKTASSDDTRNALKAIKAYANFPIKDAAGQTIGVVCLSSTSQKWFFVQSQIRTLSDIAHRLGLLLTHVKEKEARQELLSKLKDSNAKLAFIQEIEPSLEEQVDIYGALQRQVAQIQAAAAKGAENDRIVVSCYLRDEAQDCFVLAAEAGWADGTWLHAARYREGEGMTGSLALVSEAHYIPDLVQFKLDRGISTGKYVKQMFGRASESGYTYEVITLPLKLKETEPSLGILTLHRRHPLPTNAELSGFCVTDGPTLTKAARIEAAFIAKLWSYDLKKWRQGDDERFGKVNEALRDAENETLTDLLSVYCHAVIHSYRFQECGVYLVDPSPRLRLQGWVTRIDRALSPGERMERESNPRLRWVLKHDRYLPIRSKWSKHPGDPRAVEVERLFEGAYLPLHDGAGVIGVLELRWRGRRRRISNSLPHHVTSGLERLAGRLQRAIKSHSLRHDSMDAKKRSSRALSTMGKCLELHPLTNNIQAIQSILRSLQIGAFPIIYQNHLRECQKRIAAAREFLLKVANMGASLASMDQQICALGPLVMSAVEKVLAASPSCSIDTEDLKKAAGIFVHVDERHMREALIYLMENAVRVTQRDKSIKIYAEVNQDDGEASVYIQDQGPGMKRVDFEKFLRGSTLPSQGQGAGMGIFLAGQFCAVNLVRIGVDERSVEGTVVKLTFAIIITTRP